MRSRHVAMVMSIPRTVIPALQPVGGFCISQTSGRALPFYQKKAAMTNKACDWSIHTSPLRIFLASDIVSAVCQILCRMRVIGKWKQIMHPRRSPVLPGYSVIHLQKWKSSHTSSTLCFSVHLLKKQSRPTRVFLIPSICYD